MGLFDYLAVFYSLIIGLAVARVLSGFAALITHRKAVSWYLPFVVWGLFLLLFAGWEWWLISRWRSFTDWTFARYFFISLRPSLLYFAAHILVPEFTEFDEIDLRAHFDRSIPWVATIFTAVVLLGFVDTALKGSDYLMRLLPRQTAISGTAIILSVTASRVRRPALSLSCAVGLLVLYFTASMLI